MNEIVNEMIRERNTAVRQMREMGRLVKRAIDAADMRANDGRILNSLGEIQQLGAQYDAMVATVATWDRAIALVRENLKEA